MVVFSVPGTSVGEDLTNRINDNKLLETMIRSSNLSVGHCLRKRHIGTRAIGMMIHDSFVISVSTIDSM